MKPQYLLPFVLLAGIVINIQYPFIAMMFAILLAVTLILLILQKFTKK